MSGTVLVLTCAMLIFAAARGEALLALSDRAKRALGLLSLLTLTGCLVTETSCEGCHDRCGVWRDSCHAHCDEMHCKGGDSDLADDDSDDDAEVSR